MYTKNKLILLRSKFLQIRVSVNNLLRNYSAMFLKRDIHPKYISLCYWFSSHAFYMKPNANNVISTAILVTYITFYSRSRFSIILNLMLKSQNALTALFNSWAFRAFTSSNCRTNFMKKRWMNFEKKHFLCFFTRLLCAIEILNSFDCVPK